MGKLDRFDNIPTTALLKELSATLKETNNLAAAHAVDRAIKELGEEWQPIATALVPPREVLKHGTWPCLLQDRKGNVVGGHAAYVKDRLGPNPDRLHRSRPPTYRIQWYHGLRIAGRSMVFKPVYWMPLPAPRKD